MKRILTSSFALMAFVLIGITADRTRAQTIELSPQIEPDIQAVSISPDNRLIATAGLNSLALWDAHSGRQLRLLRGSVEPISSIQFSPDSKKLWVADFRAIRLWDVESGQPLRTIASRQGEEFKETTFSRDGSRILTATSERVMLFDAATGRELKDFKQRGAFFPRLSTDNETLLISSGDPKSTIASDKPRVSVWNAVTGQLIFELSGITKATAASFGLNGESIVTWDSDGEIREWDLQTRRVHRQFPSLGVREVRINQGDGSLLLIGRDHVHLWNSNGRELLKFEGRVAAISSDGQSILVANGHSSRTWAPNYATLYSILTGKQLQKFEGRSKLAYSLTFSADSKRVLVGAEDAASLWDIELGRIARRFKGHSRPVTSVALSLDGKTALTGGMDDFALLWDVKSGEILRRLGPVSGGKNGLVDGVYFSAAGDKVLTEADIGSISRLWDVSNGREISSFGSRMWRKSNSLSADGSRVLTAEKSDNSLLAIVPILQDANTKQVIKKFRSGEIRAGSILPDGSGIFTGTNQGEVRFEGVSGRRRVFSGHHSAIAALSFGLEGRRLLTASEDGQVKIWDVGSGQELSRLSVTNPLSISLSPDGEKVATISSSGVIEILNANSGHKTVSLISFDEGNWLAITPEGFFDASSPAAAQKLNVVRGLEVYSIDQAYQALYRPDLVREKLAGDPKGLVREGAAKLDLSKVIASGAAPRVSIVTPAGNVDSDEVTVEALIAEQNGGGIGRIEWHVNGVTLGIESRGLDRLLENSGSSSTPSRPPVVVKRTLALEPGENRIEAIAYNGRNLIASDPAQVVLKWNGEKNAAPPKLYVLAVGVNDYYDSRLRLSYAVPDARSLGDAFRQAGSSLYHSVEVTSVLDDKVTVDNLDQVFTDLGKKVHPRDVFVFFLAGHGKTVDGRYHFLPQNFRYEDETSIVKRGIDQERFQAWFAKIPARKSILLYDTCESGSLTGDRIQQRGIERVAALEKMTRAMGRTVLSASSDDAPALEGYRGHGVFTYALLDGLQAADTNGNGLIEVTELAAFVDQKVPDLSYQAFKMRQIPQMKIVGSSFPVASKTAVLQVADSATSSEPVPTKPTHVVISTSPVDVYAAATHGGAAVHQLVPGTTVTLIETNNGWQLIAKDGRKLGYVEEKMLTKLQ